MIGMVRGLLERAGRLPAARLAIVVFLLATAVRVGWIGLGGTVHPSLHWDAAHDVVIARNLADGHGFANEPGHPTAYRYPLYPLFLSVFFVTVGEHYMAVWLIQAILGGLVCAAVAWTGARYGGVALGWVAGLLATISPEPIAFTGMLLTETLFSALLALSLILAMRFFSDTTRAGTGALTGLVFGLASLCRPVALLWLVLLMASSILLAKTRPLRASVRLLPVVGACLLVILPWLIRNAVVMGAPVLSTSGGVTFWMYRHNDEQPGDSTTATPEEFEEAVDEARLRDLAMQGGDPADMIPVYNLEPSFHAFYYHQDLVDRFSGLGEVEADAEFIALALDYIRRKPLRTLRDAVADLFETLVPSGMNGRVKPLMFFVLPFLLPGFRRMAGMGRAVSVPLLTMLASMPMVSFLFYFDHRFRLPYEPFMMLPAALGLLTFATGRADRRDRMLLLAGWAAVSLACWFELFGQQSG